MENTLKNIAIVGNGKSKLQLPQEPKHQQPQQPVFKTGEYITIKGILFKTQKVQKNNRLRLVLKSCGKQEVEHVNKAMEERRAKEAEGEKEG